MSPELKQAIDRAESLLQGANAITVAIEQVELNLPGTIQRRLEAELELADAEATAAIAPASDKAAVAAAAAALRALSVSRDKLDSLTARRRGLQAKQETLAIDLILAHQALQKLLPAHRQEASAAFEGEWSKACEVFGRTLRRRRAFESGAGARFDLPEPQAAESGETIDVGDLGRPGVLLGQLAEAITSVGESAAAAKPIFRAATGTIQADAIYEFRRAWRDFAFGTLTSGALLGTDGDWLLAHHYIRPVDASRPANDREAVSNANR